MSDDDDRRAALDRLPVPYSEALRLRSAGIAEATIAEILGVAPEAVGNLMRVAEAKLAAARQCGGR